jgi:hypothetical protein
VILPILPELQGAGGEQAVLGKEYSSADELMTREEIVAMLTERKLLIEDRSVFDEQEMLA